MKSRIVRAGAILLEAAGVAFAAVLACTAFLFWRVQSAPVVLDWSAPMVRSLANATVFDGAVARIGTISLSRSNEAGGYHLDLGDVSLGGGDAGASAKLPTVEIEFFPSDLLSGKVGPRRLLVDGAHLRIVRRGDRKLRLEFGESGGERARVFRSLTGGAYFREAFKRADLRNTSITFYDEASGRTWRGSNGDAAVERTTDGYAAELTSDFEIGGKAADLELQSRYDVSTEIISSQVHLRDAPVGDLVAVLFGEEAQLLTSPISGDAVIDISSDGRVLASQIDLVADKGTLTVGEWSTGISRFSASAGFDPARNEFDVKSVEWDSAAGVGSLGGVVALEADAAGKGVARISFSVAGEGLTIVYPSAFDEAVTVDQATLTGVYDIAGKNFDVSALSMGFLGASLGGRVSITKERGVSPAVTAAIRIDGALSPQSLLKVWPRTLAEGAREFVETRVPKGVFSAVDFTMDLKAGGIAADGALPDEAMTLTFRADDAEVFYAPEMTPLTGVSGAGTLRGNSFRFQAEKAQAANVSLADGKVEIPVLMPKGQPAIFRFKARGDTGDILRVLDEAPLSVLKDTNFSAQQFSGPATATVEIRRPNLRIAPPEDYRFNGVAFFDRLAVEGIIGEASLSGGKGRLDLNTDGMVIKGDAHVGDAPVTIEWRQKFAGGGDNTFIDVKGVANSTTADLFGIPTRQMVQGDVPFTAKATGGVDALRALELEADLSSAALVSEQFGWMKPAGAPATGKATFAFSPEGTRVSALSLSGGGAAIAGSADFDATGAITNLDIPTFSLDGAADLAISGVKSGDGSLAMTVDGAYLNAGEMIKTAIDNGIGDNGGKSPFNIAARIERVDFRAGASYRDASLDFRRSADSIDVLKFTAVDAAKKPLSIELKQAGAAEGEQTFEARSEDVGLMLAGIFGLTSVKGGEGWLDFSFTPGVPGAPRKGALAAHDLRVVKAPLFAKIFAAGSLTGLADLMSGEGIEFKDAMARFAIENDAVRVIEARATGPSVGITAQGGFALEGDRAVTLSGAVAPAYQFNSFLGKAPVIGGLFVNRKGEGLLALSYDVSGPAAEPRVTVNPLSALAPGVFRRMFEGEAAAQEQTPPQAAEQ